MSTMLTIRRLLLGGRAAQQPSYHGSMQTSALNTQKRLIHTTQPASFLKSTFKRITAPKPPVARFDSVATSTTTWHGTPRSDEFGWMQHPENEADLAGYIEQENAYARQMAKGTKRLQKQIAKEMHQATEADQIPQPVETQSGNYIYYSRTNTNGCVVYCRRPAVDPSNGLQKHRNEQILMDSGTLENKFGYQLRNLLVSDEHDCFACLVAKNSEEQTESSESSTLLVYSINDSGKTKLVETLNNMFNFVFGAGHTLFYTVLNDKLRADKVLGHRIGCHQSQDILVYAEKNNDCFLDITRTKDKQFHIISSSTLDSSEAHIFQSNHDFWQTNSQPSSPLYLLRARQRGVEYFVDHHDEEFIILTNSPENDHSRDPIADPLPFRLVRTDTDKPTSAYWTELLGVAGDEVIEDVEIFRKYIVVSMRRHGHPAVFVYDRVLGSRSELDLPYDGNCTVRPQPSPQFDATSVRLGFSTPVHLDSVVEYDMETLQKRSIWAPTPLHINPSEYVVRQVKAANGKVDIPMTLIHHESVLFSQHMSPTLVRVYGAYGVPLDLEFRLEDIPLLRRGWTIALAHVRGGGELGREWYASGRTNTKLNTVNDLLACVRYLLEKGITKEELLTVTGVSAGGLAVGAALNAHPEYFRAATLHVPFVDPLSAMLSPDLPLTNVETAEWGNPLDNPADYRYISQYAPYDNIKEAGAKRQAMPSILVTAGGQDRRVSVWQPAKWVARLRSRGGYSESVKSVGDSLEAKLLFMASMNAGHFHSSSKSGEDGLDFIHAHALRNAFLIAETKQ